MRTIATLALFVPLATCQACRGCAPDLPPPDTDRDTDRDTDIPADTDTDRPVETGESDVDPCQWPEVEPDGFEAPSPIAPEELGCGAFLQPLDLDWWRFTVQDDGWVRVRVAAREIGSRADPQVSLTGDNGTIVAMGDREDSQDVLLTFPADADSWRMFVGDQLNNGGEEGFHYELLVSSAKAPIDCFTDENEAGGNDTLAVAPELEVGCVYGAMDDGADQDWYEIRVPAGKHALTFDVEAAQYGSPVDTQIDLFDAAGTPLAEASDGPRGYEIDPFLDWTSEGDETLYVRIRNEWTGEGRAYWYVLLFASEEV